MSTNTQQDALSAAGLDDERDPDQAWFWTEEWQAAEREADEDIKAGRVTHYETADDFLAGLDAFAHKAG